MEDIQSKLLSDWINDLKELQTKFDIQKKKYSFLGHFLYISNILLISSNTLAASLNPKGYSAVDVFLNFATVTLMSIRKYINPEGRVEKYKAGYLQCKTLEDRIESETINPQKSYGEFVAEIQKEKEKILRQFY